MNSPFPETWKYVWYMLITSTSTCLECLVLLSRLGYTSCSTLPCGISIFLYIHGYVLVYWECFLSSWSAFFIKSKGLELLTYKHIQYETVGGQRQDQVHQHSGEQVGAPQLSGTAATHISAIISLHSCVSIPTIAFNPLPDDARDQKWIVWSQPIPSLHRLGRTLEL